MKVALIQQANTADVRSNRERLAAKIREALVDSEILIRGNIVMDGYLDNDTENKKVFSDGW